MVRWPFSSGCDWLFCFGYLWPKSPGVKHLTETFVELLQSGLTWLWVLRHGL